MLTFSLSHHLSTNQGTDAVCQSTNSLTFRPIRAEELFNGRSTDWYFQMRKWLIDCYHDYYCLWAWLVQALSSAKAHKSRSSFCFFKRCHNGSLNGSLNQKLQLKIITFMDTPVLFFVLFCIPRGQYEITVGPCNDICKQLMSAWQPSRKCCNC